MKYKKSELDIFLQERIRENKEELCRNLDATLQYEQNCLEEIVKGIKHCKSNHCCPVKILKYHLSSNSRNSVLDIQALI